MKTRSTLLTLSLFAAGTVACLGPAPVELAEPTFHEARFTAVRFVAAPPPEVAPAPVVKKKTVRRAPAPVVDEVVELALDEAEDALLPWILSDASFNATIDDWTGVRTCVATQRVQSGGAFSVEMSIDNSGAVKSAKVVDASNSTANAVAPCVAAKARRLGFPAYASNETTTRVAKFVF